jgi:hypothetical protein
MASLVSDLYGLKREERPRDSTPGALEFTEWTLGNRPRSLQRALHRLGQELVSFCDCMRYDQARIGLLLLR